MTAQAPTSTRQSPRPAMTPPARQTAEVDSRLRDLDHDAIAMLPAKLQWRLAAYYRATGAFAESGRVLDAAERRSGESMQLLEERARLAFAMGRHDDARRLLEERV